MTSAQSAAAIYPPRSTPPDRHHAGANERAWLDVDLSAVRHNAAQLRAAAGVPLIAMVKANSYGVGAVAVARALGAPFGSDPGPSAPWGLGIATLDEAFALRAAGCTAPLVCCTPLLVTELREAQILGVRPALHRPEDIRTWQAIGGGAWHLSIDTGMARAGVRWDAVQPLRDALHDVPPEGVFTHFHSVDESLASREEQDRRFAQALQQLEDVLPAGVLEHRDNSGGIVSRTTSKGGAGHSPGQLVRPGIALYAGMFVEELGLRQVAHLRARIVDIRQLSVGESVSYGATWTAPDTRRIATLPVGYADGYRRHLSNAGQVLVRGRRCPVVGRVTMDMTMVDVTVLDDDTRGPVQVGEVATLIGGDGVDELSVGMVATLGGVSPYELLVGLTLRAPAVYHDLPAGGGTDTTDRPPQSF